MSSPPNRSASSRSSQQSTIKEEETDRKEVKGRRCCLGDAGIILRKVFGRTSISGHFGIVVV